MDQQLWQRAAAVSGPAQNLFAVTGPGRDPAVVAAADPLDADGLMARLPTLNSTGQHRPLVDWLAAIAADPAASRLGPPDSLAAMRDVGMALGSLQRHGIHPVDIAPELTALLETWGQTASMVPRDTVVHYGLWNPTGPRERRYTQDPQESVLIGSVRSAAGSLTGLALNLYLAHAHGLDCDDGCADLTASRECLRDYVQYFELVRSEVSPVFFARSLRPYFDPVEVSGISYHGPAAAFLPMYLVDVLLWGDAGPQHRDMMNEAADYGLPQWRTLLRVCGTLPTLTDAYADLILRFGSDARRTREGAVIDEMLRLLVRFRGRHTTLARQAYAATDYDVGSGGYSPDLLVAITRATRDAECSVNQVMGEADG